MAPRSAGRGTERRGRRLPSSRTGKGRQLHAACDHGRGLDSFAVSVGDKRVAGSLTAHSCKAAMLSWAAKAGWSFDTRRALGGYAGGENWSMSIYSRDYMAGPLRDLERLVEMIRAGMFVPDCMRSGKIRDISDEGPEAESDDSTDDTSSEEDAQVPEGEVQESGGFVLNLRTGVAHLEDASVDLMRCGPAVPLRAPARA